MSTVASIRYAARRMATGRLTFSFRFGPRLAESGAITYENPAETMRRATTARLRRGFPKRLLFVGHRLPPPLYLLHKQRLNIRFRVKRLHVFELLADADELDRQAELLLDGEHRAAFRRAVQLR